MEAEVETVKLDFKLLMHGDIMDEVPSVIVFESPFFNSIKETSFRTLEATDEPIMVMVLAQGEVTLTLSGVKKELKLEETSADANMLQVVADSLKFVQELHVGDDVPSELTTGEASWDVTDAHRAIAHNRVTMQLVSWVSGDEALIIDPDELAQVVDDPKTKKKITNAFFEAAKALGIHENQNEVVLGMIANLAEELSFIEALRDNYNEVELIQKKVDELKNLYGSDLRIIDTISSVNRLFQSPLNGFRTSFSELDAQTGEVIAALSNIKTVTSYIRENRDNLHRRLWAWKSFITDWENFPIKRSAKVEPLLNDLYHFLAQRFLPRNEWELYSKAKDKTKKRSTEVEW